MNDTRPSEERLLAEIEALKRQLEEQKRAQPVRAAAKPGPSATSLVLLGLLVALLIVVGFFAGYLPRQRREHVLAAETKTEAESLPVVTAALVTRSATRTELVLPGNIQPVTEAPVLARASGYLRKRSVDIGDRVKEGQVLAEIEAPELDQQIRQAEATRQQAASAVQQAEAALEQGRSNERLAKVTADRWANLVLKGAVSRQENDVYQAQYASQQANVQALEKAAAAVRGSVAADEANIARLNDLKGYLTVRAPFAGVITVRNVDVGALITEGSTLLYRLAQTGVMRTFVNVPQSDADSVQAGQLATLEIADLTGPKFSGRVTRTSSALDPASRTLLAEVQVQNVNNALLPGMFTQVDLQVPRKNPPLLIPGDTLVVRADGPQVAVVGPDGTVHFTRIQLGRDYGDHIEVLSGLEEGQQLVVNPSDLVREGVRVKAVKPDGPAQKTRT